MTAYHDPETIAAAYGVTVDDMHEQQGIPQVAEEVKSIEHQMLELAAQRRAVLALHHRRPWVMSDPMAHDDTQFSDVCDHCRRAYPCPTVQALAGEDDASCMSALHDGPTASPGGSAA